MIIPDSFRPHFLDARISTNPAASANRFRFYDFGLYHQNVFSGVVFNMF